MSKSILIADELKLLLLSEEAKNTQIYGNLYKSMKQLKDKKLTALSDCPNLDEKAKAALIYNKRTLFDNIILEWQAEDINEEDTSQQTKCGLCNSSNKYVYFIRNRKNNKRINVGSYCITKFPGIEGYKEQKQRINERIKNQNISRRRTIFMSQFPHADEIIKKIEIYFNKLPILLDYNLYSQFENLLTNLRLIMNTYINKGECVENSKTNNPFEDFKIHLKEFEDLRLLSKLFILKNKDNALICKRREIDYLLKNNYKGIVIQISRNNGLYDINTIKYISSFDFIADNISTIKEKSHLIKAQSLKIDKDRQLVYTYLELSDGNSHVLFSLSFKEFMHKVGGACLIDSDYNYDDFTIVNEFKLRMSENNLYTLINYINDIIESYNCIFLLTENNKLYLYRLIDKSVRQFNLYKFAESFQNKLINTPDEIRNTLKNIVLIKAQWTYYKQSNDENLIKNINKLLKSHQNNEYNKYHKKHQNLDNYIEIPMYSIIFNNNLPSKIDFNSVKILRIKKRSLNKQRININKIDYAIKVFDDSMDPLYKMGDIVLVNYFKHIRPDNIYIFTDKYRLNIRKVILNNDTQKKNFVPINNETYLTYTRIKSKNILGRIIAKLSDNSTVN